MVVEKHFTVRAAAASTLWFLCGFVLTPLVMTAAAFGVLDDMDNDDVPVPFQVGIGVGIAVYCLGGPILVIIAIVLGKAHVIL